MYTSCITIFENMFLKYKNKPASEYVDFVTLFRLCSSLQNVEYTIRNTYFSEFSWDFDS